MKKSTITPKMLKAIAICALLVFGVTGTAAARKATPSSSATVTWTGNGTTLTEGSRTLNTETCDDDSTPYLLWILAGSKATSATITINDGSSVPMGQPGINKKTGISTFKYLMPGTIDLDTATVIATYNDAKNKATLTISHGCTGESGAELTVVFLGEIVPGAGGAVFGPLGSTMGPSTTTSVCETAVPNNCVTFNASGAGTLPSESGTLTMSATGTLTLNSPTGCLVTGLYTSSLTALEAALSLYMGEPPTPIAAATISPGVTTETYPSTDTATVYIVQINFC